MAEKGNDKPAALDSGLVFWAWDGTATDTDGSVIVPPDTSRKTNGWSTSVADRPDASHMNWLFRELSKVAAWAGAALQRSFDELADAWDSPAQVALGDLFVVERPASPVWGARASVQAPAGATALDALTTDGVRLYLNQGTTVYAVNVDDPGTSVWSRIPEAGTTPAILEACGEWVLCLYPGTGASSDVRFLDPADGTDLYPGLSRSLPTTTTHPSGACNGDLVAFATGSNARLVELYRPSTTTSLTAAIQWGGGTAGEIVDMAMDGKAVYATGEADSNGDEVAAYPLTGSTTALWTTSLPATAGTPSGRAIAADGDFVFVGSDRVTTASGSDRGLWCLNALTGEVVWEAATSGNVLDVAVDQSWVYVSDSANVEVYDKHTGHRVRTVAQAASPYSLCCDGVDLHLADGDEVASFQTSRASVTMQRVDTTAPARRPFHNTFIPLER